jgi:hypothetical protein
MECNASDIIGVTLKGQKGVGIGGLDIVKFDAVMASSCQKPLIWGNAKSIHLGIRMLNGS